MAGTAWATKLNTGAIIPSFGIGTWQSPKGAVGNAVQVAVRAGYRHIDCAWYYLNEEEIGEALEILFKEGVVKREELFITSKLWNAHQDPEEVQPACCDTLKKLKLDYLDLYLIHGPLALKKDTKFPPKPEDMLGYDAERMGKTWKAMEDLVQKGLVRAIGISNFSITKTENLLKTAKIVPAVNQVECHTYFQQHKLRKYCKQKGIVFEAYAPLGSPGRRSQQSGDPVVMEDPVIKEIAEKHGATPGQICISFLLHLGVVTIPKSTNEGRIKENLAATRIRLTPEEVETLKGVDRNKRLFAIEVLFKNENFTTDSVFDVTADEAFVL